MPELPDITLYVEALDRELVGRRLRTLRFHNPFVLRSVEPPVSAMEGRVLREVRRLGKRIALGLEGELWIVIHLMIAGRLQWRPASEGRPRGTGVGKIGLAAWDFETGTLLLTEAGSTRRASVHLVSGESELAAHARGGVEVLDASLEVFRGVLRAENHTLKRSLTDPRLFSGIGNAYSDEILHRAGLSPVALSQTLPEDQVVRLYEATHTVLREWIARLRAQSGTNFPRNVTAFRPEMAVHGRYGLPCPVCQTLVQRIRYAENETNYCPRCQTGGRILADRSLSRLLNKDWPRTIEELEQRSS